MSYAYLVTPRRLPVGRRKGGLSQVHPVDLAAAGMRASIDASGVDPGAVDDVIFGCVGQVGPQTGNIARLAWLTADLPEHVPGVTIDRQCGSAQQAVQFAAQAVLSGTADLVLAGGVEAMTTVPIMSPAILGMEAGMPAPFAAAGWVKRYGEQEISQFRGAELIAEKWGIERADMEQYALRSHQLAAAAIAGGKFDDEIVPAFGLSADEGPRPDSTLEKMAGLKTLTPGGRLTAAVSSQISDGSAAVLVASEEAVTRHGLQPVARCAQLRGRGLGSGLHVVRADPGHREGFAASRSHHRRHRHLRGERGVRVGCPGLDEGHRSPDREGQPQWWGHRPGASAGRDRCPSVDHDGPRTAADGRPLWPAGDVRGGRHGQRDDRGDDLTVVPRRGGTRRG